MKRITLYLTTVLILLMLTGLASTSIVPGTALAIEATICPHGGGDDDDAGTDDTGLPTGPACGLEIGDDDDYGDEFVLPDGPRATLIEFIISQWLYMDAWF